ncbi:MAG TPA: hypothetical protein VFS30_07695 [Dehalococcoidia bacterium]|nr:hypothetical protein [Dehalococcoidia bacterium]
MTPAIVVITYDRPHTLERLLTSLDAAKYPEGVEVPLVLTTDRGDSAGSQGVVRLAKGFEWRFGPKRVIEQPRHLGLVDHFWAAGRLSHDYDAIVLLEDDLTVAPPFYHFAWQALTRYEKEPRIGGLCLYDLWFNGYTQLPFRPLNDGADAYFVQVPYTQGYAMTSVQWQRFDEWWQRNGPAVTPHPALHASFLRFRQDEWLPAMASYLAQEERYFCFPRASLSTGWGDAGVHFDARTDWFLAPVQVSGGDYRLPGPDESMAVYDSFFELTPSRLRELAPSLPGIDFDVDLNATKLPSNLQHEHVLTTRPTRRAMVSFGLRLQPAELNVIQGVPGDEISLARLEDVYWGRLAGLEARRKLEKLAWSKRRPSRRRAAAFLIARGVNRLRRLKDGPAARTR